MKRKIAYITIAAAVSVAAFFAGKKSVKPETLVVTAPINYDTYCQVISNIVDWNTDGKELSVTTADRQEYYAYKSEDAYGERRQYISLEDITDYTVSDEGLQLYTNDGNGYWWEK